MIQDAIFYSHFSFLKEQVCLCHFTAVPYRNVLQTFTVFKVWFLSSRVPCDLPANARQKKKARLT